MNLLESIRNSLKSRPVRKIESDGRTQASVAMLLRSGQAGLEVLLIERATQENDNWSGHIAFPGGKLEPDDPGARQAAERETCEEIGVDLSQADYLGQLDEIVAGSLPIVVSCFVFAMTSEPKFRLSTVEVADAFWFPLIRMDDPDRQTMLAHTHNGISMTYPAVKVDTCKDQPLWGITYELLKSLKALT